MRPHKTITKRPYISKTESYSSLGFKWRHILGFFTWPLLYRDMAKKFHSGSTFVEVGVFEGKSLGFMIEKVARQKKKIKIIGVDHFKGQSKDMLLKVKENLKMVEKKYSLICESSVDAAKLFEDKSIEFVFLDAGHRYEEIKSDIIAWLPKIKSGGVLAGHDYYYDDNGVKKAVDELFGDRVDLKYIDENCWLYVSD